MSNDIPKSLQPDDLMTHMRVLCQEIGARPPTSNQERAAADYVQRILSELGFDPADVTDQPFKSPGTLGLVSIPIALMAGLAMPLAGLGGRWAKLGGAALLAGAIWSYLDINRAKTPFFQPLIAQGNSQNISITIPAQGEQKRHIVLVGHLDTQKQRFTLPLPDPTWMKPAGTASVGLALLGGLSLLNDGLQDKTGLRWWQKLLGAGLLAWLPITVYDEFQPHIEGANDNASAVSVLLGLAEELRQNPLENSAVTLLFTGCEEVGCVGMAEYLKATQPHKTETFFVDLEMVGTGNICFVSQHGISHLTGYKPDLKTQSIAARAARNNKALGVVGQEMLIIDEVGTLRNQGYQAICVAGYGEDGQLPNWHRISDNLANIEPETLSRAAQYTLALVQEIDADARRPY